MNRTESEAQSRSQSRSNNHKSSNNKCHVIVVAMKINTNALTFIAVGVMMEVLSSNAAGIRTTQAKDRRFGRHLKDETDDDENSCLSISKLP